MRGGASRLACGLLLALLTFAAFFPTLGADYLNWDDRVVVRDNPRLSELTLENLRAIWRGSGSRKLALYIPLTQTSLAMDRALFGPGPTGHHAMNVILHLAAGFVLLGFLEVFLRDRPAAFVATTVFLVHPAQVESVAWITERSSVLSALLIFLTLRLYLLRTASDHGRFSPSAEWPVLLAAAGALLAKPIAVVIPPLLVALDLTRPRGNDHNRALSARDVKRAALSKWPYALLAVLAGWATFRTHALAHALVERDAWQNALTILSVVFPYLRIALFPTSLAAIHVTPIREHLGDPSVLAGLVALVVGGGALLALSRRSPVVAFFVVWAAACILPVSNLIPIDIYVAERYLYLPLVALAAPLALGFSRVGAGSGPLRRNAIAAAAVAIVLCMVALTHARSGVWRNSESLWQDTLAKSPTAMKAHANYGALLLERGDAAGALPHLFAAVRLGGRAENWGNLGVALLRQHRAAEALVAFGRAKRAEPEMVGIDYWLGRSLAALGRNAEALDALGRAKRAEPDKLDIDYWRGRTLAALGRNAEAVRAYQEEIERQPSFAAAWVDLGKVLAALDRLPEALQATERAAALKTDDAEALFNLGVLRWFVTKDAAGSRGALEKSLRLGLTGDSAHRARAILDEIDSAARERRR